MKHPHDEMIRAWLDGKAIEVFNVIAQQWQPVRPVEDWILPPFRTEWRYRLKPDPAVFKYRRFVWRDKVANKDRIAVIEDGILVLPDNIESRDSFVRWIDTEWQVLEVEL